MGKEALASPLFLKIELIKHEIPDILDSVRYDIIRGIVTLSSCFMYPCSEEIWPKDPVPS